MELLIVKRAAASIGEFQPITNASPRPVKVYPGDFAINGRNEQSIRIGKSKGVQKGFSNKIKNITRR